jgi:hypothetical protein
VCLLRGTDWVFKCNVTGVNFGLYSVANDYDDTGDTAMLTRDHYVAPREIFNN